MRSVKYSVARLSIGLAAGMLFTPPALYGLRATEGKLWLASAIFAFLGPALIVGCTKKLLSDRFALRWDARSLEVTGLWLRSKIAWSEVRQIGVTVTTTHALGVVKTAESHSLTIVAENGRGGTRKHHVSRIFLEDHANFPAVIADLNECLDRVAQGEPAVPAAMARAAPRAASPATPALNGLGLPQARSGGFGRRGL